MDRQLHLKLTDRAEREANFDVYFGPLGFEERELAILRLIFSEGDRVPDAAEHVWQLRISLDRAAKLVKPSKRTLKKGIDSLRIKGLIVVDDASEPWRYVVNWLWFADYEPTERPDPLANHPILTQNRRPPDTPGYTLPDSLSINPNSNIPDPDTLEPDSLNRSDSPGRDHRGWPLRPWTKHQGFTDDDLRRAVQRQNFAFLKFLYDTAVGLGWILPVGTSLLDFLTCCHHAATTSGIHSPRAALYKRVQDKLDTKRTRTASDDWAGYMLRQAAKMAEFQSPEFQRDKPAEYLERSLAPRSF